MELMILENKRNEMLKRQEITVEVDQKTSSSKKQLREKLAALMNTKEENIVIIKIDSNFGSSKAKAYARIYESAEELKKREEKYIIERNFGKEKKAEVENNDAPANFKK